MGERTPGARAAATQRAEVIAERAVAYAEREIEGVELAELLAVDLVDEVEAAMRDGVDPAAVKLSGRTLAQFVALRVVNSVALASVVTRNMEVITHALARAFTVGYGAKIDDASPADRLGGTAEDERRRRRRG